MKLSHLLLAFLGSLFVVLLSNNSATTNSLGPAPNMVGLYGNQSTCNVCHNSYPLNNAGGGISISIADSPTAYTPGNTYVLTVTVSQVPAAARYGFEIAAVDVQNQNVGTFTAIAGTQIVSSVINGNNIAFLEHNTPSTSGTWTFSWTAPAVSQGTVRFYASGVAANNNNNSSGDYVYTTLNTLSSSCGNAILNHATVKSCTSQTGVNLNNYVPAQSSSGTWSGAGVTGSTFSPGAVGVGTYNLVFSTGNNGCDDKDTLQMQVVTQKNAVLTSNSAITCTQTLTGSYTQVNVTPGLIDDPVGIFNDGTTYNLYLMDQHGKILKMNAATGTISSTPFLDITTRVDYGGEKGLLGMAFHPNFNLNGYIYVNYTRTSGGQLQTVIARYTVPTSPLTNNADFNSEFILLTINQPYTNHNGGCLAFGQNGYLYIGMGDGGSANDPQNNAQNGASLLGKMLRIDVNAPSGSLNYSIPPSNPFLTNANVRDEVWALGMRNPWRFSFDRQTGDMWIGDVGQNVWEEIDFEPANSPGGLNYGWRGYEGNHTFNTSGCGAASNYTSALWEYDHSTGGQSITGGVVYRGSVYPALQGHYFYADYVNGKIWSLYKVGNTWTNKLWFDTPFYLSTFGEDINGELYFASLTGNNIYRLSFSNAGNTIDLNNYVAPSSDEGNWSGNFVTNGVFNAASAGVGTYTTTFSTGNAAGCDDTETLTINVVSSISPAISGTANVCQTNVYSYSVPAVAGTVYEWSVSGDGTIISGQETNQITVQWNTGTAGTVNVTQTAQ